MEVRALSITIVKTPMEGRSFDRISNMIILMVIILVIMIIMIIINSYSIFPYI